MNYAVEYTDKLEKREEFQDVEEAFEFFEKMRLKADISEAVLLDEDDFIMETYVK